MADPDQKYGHHVIEQMKKKPGMIFSFFNCIFAYNNYINSL